MHPYRSTSSFTDVSNIVDLGHYRKARRLRSADLRRLPLRAAEKSSADLWLHDDYRERMKVNAVVFVFLLLLITSGVWLLDGLAASFGPERLLHHHAQNRDMGPDRMVRCRRKSATFSECAPTLVRILLQSPQKLRLINAGRFTPSR
jgi:hypothetical protein